jgi:hypothetical protein
MPRSRYATPAPPAAFLALLAVLTVIQTARAWHDEGHYYAAVAATKNLPDDVPAFFRDGSATVGHGALDPDVFKNPGLPQLNNCESPEHFLDAEMLEGRDLPALRYDYLKMCIKTGVDPTRAGTLPYSITEWTQRLTMAFAEHRKDPDNPHIRAKCLVFAGILSHYAADLHMPLHTTIHWDGRAVKGERYVRTGIHNKVDALPTKVPYNELFAEPLPTALASPDVFTFTLEELAASHAQVQRVYELEPKLPDWSDLSRLQGEVREFTIQRERSAAAFTADLFLSAWRNSANITTPSWLDRKVFDETFDPAVVPPQPGQ